MFERRQKPLTKFMYSAGKMMLFILLLALALIWSRQNLMGVNEWIYRMAYGEDSATLPLRLGDDQASPQMVHRQREVFHEIYPEVLALRLDQAALARTVMSEGDYTPQDIAVYLKRLGELRLRALAFSSPLHWDIALDNMGLQSLIWSLNKHEHYALGLRAQTAALAEFTPEALGECLIPLEQVQGDITALPSANKCMPNALEQVDGLHWGVDLIVGERQMENPTIGSKKCYPLLVRWNGEIYPTIALKLALDVLGLQTKDLRVHLGQELQLGTRRIPIDDSGRCALGEVKSREILLEQFVDGQEDEAIAGKVLVIEHQPQGWNAYQGRLNNLAETLSLLLAEQEVELVDESLAEEATILRSLSWRSNTGLYSMLFMLLALWLLIIPLFSRAMLYWIYLIFIPLFCGMLFWWSSAHGLWVNWACIMSLSLVLILFTPLRWKKVRRN